MDQIDLQLLQEVFDETEAYGTGPKRLAFRAKRAQHIDRFNELERIGYLRAENERYVVSATVLRMLPGTRPKTVLNDAEAILAYMKNAYVQDQQRQVPLAELASALSLDKKRVLEAVSYMIEYPWWGGRSTDLSAPDGNVAAAEAALTLDSFNAALDRLAGWQSERANAKPWTGSIQDALSGNVASTQDLFRQPTKPPATNKPPLPDFELMRPCGLEEDLRIELKEVKGDAVRAVSEAADDYTVGFLNSEGGAIYWGIRGSDSVVTGVRLNRVDKDLLKQKVIGKLHAIQPHVPPTHAVLTFHSLGDAERELYVVVLTVPEIVLDAPFYTGGGEAFVRLDGVNQRVKGPQLTAWIRAKWPPMQPSPASEVLSPALAAHADRFRQLLSENGIEPAHLAKFCSALGAPFTATLADLATDNALLRWLDDQKMDWFTQTLNVRREWLNGEAGGVYERVSYDKYLARFWTDVQLLKKKYSDVQGTRWAYFIRAGRGREWERKGSTEIFVVIAIPMAYVSGERVVYRYITDATPYRWNYERTQIQLRAWARLLYGDGFVIDCKECDLGTAEALGSNDVFLRPILEGEALKGVDWHIDDYALSRKESAVAKDVEGLAAVIASLKAAGLPYGPIDGKL